LGYDLIHRAERWLTALMIVIFAVTLFLIHYPAGTVARWRVGADHPGQV